MDFYLNRLFLDGMGFIAYKVWGAKYFEGSFIVAV